MSPHFSHRVLALAALLLTLPVAVSHADRLVTRDGQLIETQGPWEVKGRMVIFTSTRGTLSSIRLDEVNLDASHAATAQTQQPAAATDTPRASTTPSVLSLTNEDVARGEGGAEGADGVVQRLRFAHQYKDPASAMALVHWQDTPQGIRDVMETQFEWLMERRIRDISLEEVGDDDVLLQEVDGTTFEPNVNVSHEMVIHFVPDPDADSLTLKLYVGEHLGSYFIAAARPAENL